MSSSQDRGQGLFIITSVVLHQNVMRTHMPKTLRNAASPKGLKNFSSLRNPLLSPPNQFLRRTSSFCTLRTLPTPISSVRLMSLTGRDAVIQLAYVRSRRAAASFSAAGEVRTGAMISGCRPMVLGQLNHTWHEAHSASAVSTR